MLPQALSDEVGAWRETSLNARFTVAYPSVKPGGAVNLADPGRRSKELAPYVRHGSFRLARGDRLADNDQGKRLAVHRSHDYPAVLIAIHPPLRFSQLYLNRERVLEPGRIAFKRVAA